MRAGKNSSLQKIKRFLLTHSRLNLRYLLLPNTKKFEKREKNQCMILKPSGNNLPFQNTNFLIWKTSIRVCKNLFKVNNKGTKHYSKIVQIGIFFWSVFFCIQSHHEKIRTIKNSLFGHFSRSGNERHCNAFFNCYFEQVFGPS